MQVNIQGMFNYENLKRVGEHVFAYSFISAVTLVLLNKFLIFLNCNAIHDGTVPGMDTSTL